MGKKLDSFHLKVIAIVAMFINHMGIVFEWRNSAQTLPLSIISEFVGKFTFPIMAYLLIEGFHYTRNVKKYAIRLGVFWIISIYPFYLLHNPNYTFSITDLTNNIFFTLLMGLIMLILYNKIEITVGRFFLVTIFMILTIQSDWNLIGIILIWAFYKFHNDKGIKVTMLCLFIFFEIISVLGLFTNPNSINSISEMISSFGFLVVGIILLNYNGERGYSPKWVKWGFYAFYPIHLILLELIRYLLIK